MRLIDADAMVALIREIDPTDYGTMYDYLSHGTAKDVISDVIHLVQADAPTIDAEPVRHGRNVTYTHPTDMFLCSECGFTCEITELRDEDDGMSAHEAYEYDCKYCPNCGAKMDGKTP